jgi:hypothetical protein
MIEHRHLPHVSSFRDNPIVFFTACTHKRRKLLACAKPRHFMRRMGAIGSTRRLAGWSLHSHAPSRPFPCTSCIYCAADGGLDEDVEERQLPPARSRVGHFATYLATEEWQYRGSIFDLMW